MFVGHRRRNLNQRRPEAGVEQALMVQENLLNEGTMRHFNHSGIPPTYVVRLENIPTYNPQLLASEDFKPTEPPPPYDQVRYSGGVVQGCQEYFVQNQQI